jgi:hypothetical protein
MNRWYRLSQSAAKSALKYRRQIGLGLEFPCDIYETIEKEGLELQFMDVPSLEGMCLSEREVTRICVTAHRPWGRQRFTAAHELGHYILQHGSQVDEMIESRNEETGIPDAEILADGFARFLLMPRPAVLAAFAGSPFSPLSVYRASCWLGVGYESLIRHLAASLRLISASQEKCLAGTDRQEMCRQMMGDATFKADVWPLSSNWNARTVHAQVGDAVFGLDAQGGVLSRIDAQRALVVTVGETRARLAAGGYVLIRASKRRFVGLYDYRYLPEPTDEEAE